MIFSDEEAKADEDHGGGQAVLYIESHSRRAGIGCGTPTKQYSGRRARQLKR